MCSEEAEEPLPEALLQAILAARAAK
jgi:hypothetical protein